MKRTLEQELLAWKTKPGRLPLLLRGARQVGKSYLVEHFGKAHFATVATVDFERRPDLAFAFKTREPKEIINQLEIILQKPISPGSTLLFLDEIQNCPDALSSLRYFCELLPELHVIAAGSLMEFLLNDENFSFPVGRVEFLYLHPLSFLEYLQTAAPIAYQQIHEFTLARPPSSLIHGEFLKWVRRYFFIGGMPAAIRAALDDSSFLACQRVHQRILQAYESDFGKYARHTQHKFLQSVFLRTPAIVGQILKYSRLDPDARSRDLKPALELLNRAGLIKSVYATTASGLPLHAHIRDHRFKLLFLDIGMLQTAAHVDAETFWTADLLQTNEGMLAEQFVGQELLAYADPYQNRPLLFWEAESSSPSEIDYVANIGAHIIPIEVKAGSTGSLRSLHSFLSLKKSPLGIRISEHPLSFHDNILSVPLYLIHALPKLVKEAY